MSGQDHHHPADRFRRVNPLAASPQHSAVSLWLTVDYFKNFGGYASNSIQIKHPEA